MVQHRHRRRLDPNDAEHRGSPEETWLQSRVHRKPRGAHVAELARLSGTIRAAAVSGAPLVDRVAGEPQIPAYRRGCASRMAIPLTSKTTKLSTWIQCVARTKAGCRGASTALAFRALGASRPSNTWETAMGP